MNYIIDIYYRYSIYRWMYVNVTKQKKVYVKSIMVPVSSKKLK